MKLGLTLAACLVALASGPVTWSARADASGPDVVENFTLVGNWSCTTNCVTTSGSWGIGGSSNVCVEAELESLPGGNLCVAAATFAGSIDRRCTVGVCTEQGTVTFSLPDSGEGTYSVLVDIRGATVTENAATGVEDVAASAQPMTFVKTEWRDAAGNKWDAAGELHNECAGGSGVITTSCPGTNMMFSITLTKRSIAT